MQLSDHIPSFWAHWLPIAIPFFIVAIIFFTVGIRATNRWYKQKENREDEADDALKAFNRLPEKDKHDYPAYPHKELLRLENKASAVITIMITVTVLGVLALMNFSFDSYNIKYDKAASNLQTEAQKTYGLNLTKGEASNLTRPEQDDNDSDDRPPTILHDFNSQDSSSYQFFGHTTILNPDNTTSQIQLVRVNREYKLTYYGPKTGPQNIKELPQNGTK